MSRRKRFHRVCSYRACKMAVSGARARLLCCAFVTADVRSLQYLSARVVAYSADLRPRLCLKSDCCVSEIIGSEKRAVTGDRHCGSHSKCERFGCRLFGQVARMRLDVHAQVEPLPILWDSDCSLSAVLCCADAAVVRCSFFGGSDTKPGALDTARRKASFPHYSFELPPCVSSQATEFHWSRRDTALCTYTDLDSRQDKVLGISTCNGVRSTPNKRLFVTPPSFAYRPRRLARWPCSIPLTWAIGQIARSTGGPARQGRNEDRARTAPATHAPTLDLGTAAICVRAAAERQGRKPSKR